MSIRRLAVAAALLLASCGGGDDNSGSGNNNGNAGGSGGNPPTNQPSPSGSGTSSTNWSGYARAGAIGEFTSVTGTWTVPDPRCTSGQTRSAHWIGIGGYTTGDQTLIQAGINVDCSDTTKNFSGWWEALPLPIVTVAGVSPLQPTIGFLPGDVVHVEITSAATIWTIVIQNVTKGTDFSITIPYVSSGSSVEWISEHPLSAGTGAVQPPLTDFGRVSYSSLTANGANPGLVSSERVVMTNLQGTQTQATPSAPGSGGDSFDVCFGAGAC